MPRTLVADLPPMTCADLQRFEKEGGVWGQQRSIRRNQLTVATQSTLLSSLAGFSYIKLIRHNTWYVVVGTLPLFAVAGFAAGHAAGTTLYPSVASNKETTMMRRVWWAKECAKNWDMSQIQADQWRATYPKVELPK